jgi:hypothetical protein
MLNTHNAAKAESKGLEIMKAANNTMTATAVQSDVAHRSGWINGLTIYVRGPKDEKTRQGTEDSQECSRNHRAQ